MSLKQQLARREVTLGTWVTLGHTSIVEILVKVGFDWLAIDMEHSAITLDKVQQLIQVAELSGVPPLVRVGSNDPILIKRCMDAGAHGVIVPMVNSRGDAERAFQAMRYPPQGYRGVGLARAQKYGFGFDDYLHWQGRESILIVQIEHIKAVENIEKILTVEGVDGFIIGPYDLSGSLGVPGQFDHPAVREALKHVMEVSSKLNALAGFHVIPPSAMEVDRKVKEGYRFIGVSLDTLYLGTKCREILAELKGDRA